MTYFTSNFVAISVKRHPASYRLNAIATENGLGSLLANHFPRRASLVILLLTLVPVPLFIGITALWLLFTMAVSFFALRTLMLRRIGGATRDTAGALVEISETVMLLIAALME